MLMATQCAAGEAVRSAESKRTYTRPFTNFNSGRNAAGLVRTPVGVSGLVRTPVRVSRLETRGYLDYGGGLNPSWGSLERLKHVIPVIYDVSTLIHCRGFVISN